MWAHLDHAATTSLEADDLDDSSPRSVDADAAPPEPEMQQKSAVERWLATLNEHTAAGKALIAAFVSNGPEVKVDCSYRINHCFTVHSMPMKFSMVAHGTLDNGKAHQRLVGAVDEKGRPVVALEPVKEIPHFWLRLEQLGAERKPLIVSALFFGRQIELSMDNDAIGALSSLPMHLTLQALGHLLLPTPEVLPRDDFDALLPFF